MFGTVTPALIVWFLTVGMAEVTWGDGPNARAARASLPGVTNVPEDSALLTPASPAPLPPVFAVRRLNHPTPIRIEMTTVKQMPATTVVSVAASGISTA